MTDVVASALCPASVDKATQILSSLCVTQAEATAIAKYVDQYTANNITTLDEYLTTLDLAVDIGYVLATSFIAVVLFAGFAIYEAGFIRPRTMQFVLVKDFIVVAVAAIAFWTLGYGFGFGIDLGGFIGGSKFAYPPGGFKYSQYGDRTPFLQAATSDGSAEWFQQFVCSAVAAVLAAKSLGDRTKVEGYVVFSIVFCALLYPIVVHWVWGTGFLSAYGAFPDEDGAARPLFRLTSQSNGFIDSSGGAVIHLTAGAAALVGAVIVGPRHGRFLRFENTVKKEYPANTPLLALGVLLLWGGFLALNVSHTLGATNQGLRKIAGDSNGGAMNLKYPGLGRAEPAGKILINMTLGPTATCLTTTLISYVAHTFFGYYDTGVTRNIDTIAVFNGILAGVAATSAACSVIHPWWAFTNGVIAGILLVVGNKALNALRIDDVTGVTVVHGLCGLWGSWAVGIFCTDDNVVYAGYPNENDACARGEQFGVQVAGSLVILVWSLGTSALVFGIFSLAVGLRARTVESDSPPGSPRPHLDTSLYNKSEPADDDVSSMKSA